MMKDPKNERLYLINEEDAYRIEELISLLAMAVWEILREGQMQPQPPQDDDADIAQRTFQTEIRCILKNPDLDSF